MDIRPILLRTAALLVPLVAALGSEAAVRNAVTSKDSVRAALSRISRDMPALESSLATYRENGDSVAVALTLAQMGKCYNYRSDYVEAIGCYRDAAAIQRTADPEGYTHTLISLATNCRRIGAYSSASDYLFEALDIVDRSPDKESKEVLTQRTYILNGIGNVYKYLNNGDEAENYFRQSLAIDEKIGNELGQSMNWNTIGSIYEYRQQYDSAKVMYLRALEHNNKSNSRNGAGICFNKLGQLADTQGNLDEAEDYYLQAYSILTNVGDKWNLAKTTCNLGRLCIVRGEYARAEKLLEESENLVSGNRSYGHLRDIHHNLSDLYFRQGKFRSAYDELRLCLAYQDSSFTQRSGQEVAQSRLRYEQEKSQRMIDKAMAGMESERSSKRMTLYISASVVVLLLVALFFFILYARLKGKRNRELEQMDAIKNKFFSVISHDLKNPVFSQKKVLEMLVGNFDSLPKEAVKSQCEELYKSSSSLFELLTSLLDWSRIETGRIHNDPIRLKLRDVVDDTVKLLEEQSALKKVVVSNNVSPDTFVKADRNILSTVIRNIVGNAIKFSYEGGTVEISDSPADFSQVLVRVTDCGIGMPDEKIADLYSLDRQASRKGTAGESGSGLGLIVSREMVEMAGGRLKVESEEGKGSTFSFTVNRG